MTHVGGVVAVSAKFHNCGAVCIVGPQQVRSRNRVVSDGHRLE